MTYVVTVDTCLPDGAPELDPLQREGVVFLFRKGLDSIAAIEGPDGMEVELVDDVVAVYPGGALLKLFVRAPALEFAEDAVREIVGELLERSELLADWTITKCEVELHSKLAQESLDSADSPDAPPTDPAERAAQHAGARSATESARLTENEVEAMHLKIRSLAPRLEAFGLGTFGYSGDTDEFSVARKDAELAAGALVYAIDTLLDQLFEDVTTLDEAGTSVAECGKSFCLLDELPSHFALQYTVLFVRRLTVTAVSLTARLTQPQFGQLSCVAEELLLRLLLNEAEVVLDLYGLMDNGVRFAWDAFVNDVYEDLDHEWLYEPAADGIDQDRAYAHLGIAPMGVKDWFTPFNKGRYVHPYAANDDESQPDDRSAP